VIGVADLHTAIMSAWNDAGLTAKFKALWAASEDADSTPALHDQSAAGSKAIFPYCVLETAPEHVSARMTASVDAFGEEEAGKRRIADTQITFNTHVDRVAGDGRSTKEICAYLMEEIVKVFGGHPTVPPVELTLANGSHLLTQYQDSNLIRTEQYKYRGLVRYKIKLDVPYQA
jgi:hypothetical protein